ncbi:MAG: L-seryl-tRNA(Sec) selenium transferase [Deltaproteobacteria bacterium]|nr:L-seryl-tRNA(Sec) selenium transferase [Deltaproteobacteria bacterium]
MPHGPSEDLAAEARKLPRADRLLQTAEAAGLVARLGHGPVMDRVRALLEAERERILGGGACPPPAEIEAKLLEILAEDSRGGLRRVINATGVVIHTNLGRAPLSEAAVEAMRAAAGYVNLEYDLRAGERGDRYDHAAAALCRLTGAEAALVVNNNAAAVMLALASLSGGRPGAAGATPVAGGAPDAGTHAPEVPGTGPRPEVPGTGSRPEVIVSRGQLVEIGGGFRVPDVLRRSGCALTEVGTTNRTYARDYEAAVNERTRILLSVHRSNFKLSGFVADPTLAELVELGRRHALWTVDDLGSGTLLETQPFGLGVEPTVQERVEAGADLVCFSGDKLLGGPQAGILVGRREAVDRARRHPLLRALRVDKIALAGLSATLAHYERGEALGRIPVWRAISVGQEALQARAERWRAALIDVAPGASVREGRSAVGGGSLPEVTLPTRLLALPGPEREKLAERLRRGDPAVVARIEEGLLVLDPRTVLPGEDEPLLGALRKALTG